MIIILVNWSRSSPKITQISVVDGLAMLHFHSLWQVLHQVVCSFLQAFHLQYHLAQVLRLVVSELQWESLQQVVAVEWNDEADSLLG